MNMVNIEPLSEMYETENSYIITVDLPFIKSKDQIEIYVKENEIEIIAKAGQTITWSSFEGFGKRVEVATFRKKITLPSKINPDNVKAAFKNGILIVELPKLIERRKKVEIE